MYVELQRAELNRQAVWSEGSFHQIINIQLLAEDEQEYCTKRGDVYIKTNNNVKPEQISGVSC